MTWQQIPTFVRDDKGVVRVNKAKQFVQPFELSTDNPNQIITLAGTQARGPFPLTARYDGPIELFYVKVFVTDSTGAAVLTYDIDFFLEHAGKRIQFMSRQIAMMACAGDGGRPYVLPESIYLPAVQSLQVSFTNNEAVERRVEFVLCGVKFYPFSADEKTREEVYQYTQRRERTYAYWQTTDEPLTLAAGAVDTNVFSTVPDNTDLEIFKLTAFSDGPFRCRIRDGSNDRAITGNKIHSSLLFGGHDPTALSGIGGSGGIFPARWPATFLVRRSTQLQLTFDNLLTPAAANDVDVVFGGRKVAYA